MEQVKIFENYSDRVDIDVNKWLEKEGRRVKIISRQISSFMSENKSRTTVAIFFQTKKPR
jgi:hypothetical protein